MKSVQRSDHRALAEALRRRVLDGSGITSVADRRAAQACASGEIGAPSSFNRLASRIGEAAYQVTDADVAEAVAAGGSQKAAFEIIAAAALGAGLLRWRKSIAALDEATR